MITVKASLSSPYINPFSVEIMTHVSVRRDCILSDKMKTICMASFAGLANTTSEKTLHTAMIYWGVSQVIAK